MSHGVIDSLRARSALGSSPCVTWRVPSSAPWWFPKLHTCRPGHAGLHARGAAAAAATAAAHAYAQCLPLALLPAKPSPANPSVRTCTTVPAWRSI